MKKLLLLTCCAFGISSYGQIWLEKSTGFSAASTGINEIRYVDANNVWTTGYDGAPGSGLQYRVWAKSADGGDTWTNGPMNLGSTDLGIGSIMPLSATTAYVAAFPNAPTVQGGIWKTVDGGATWTKQASAAFNTGTESFTNFVYFWDENNGVAAGDPASGYFEIYTTSDGGVNWVRIGASSVPVPFDDSEYGYTRIYEVQGERIWFGTNKGRLYRSDDRGLTWVVFDTPNTDFGDADLGASFAFQDANNGIMVFKDWQQYRTTDGGATWTPDAPDGLIRNGDVCNVPGFPDFYVNIGDDVIDVVRGSSYSNDNGLSWIDIAEPIDAISAVEFFDGTHGLASGFTASSTEGGIYKWNSNVNLFDLLATTDFQSTKAFTASPNPTTGILDIAGQNISEIAVYDILGKQVANNNYSSLNNVSLNLSALNSGVYMVKVTNNTGASSTIKVVKQ